MDFILSKNSQHQPKMYLLRAGYHEFSDPNTGKISYIRRLSANFYPRFHIYIEEVKGGMIFHLHLDQKKPSYGGGTRAHGGEYEGVVVEREVARLKEFIEKLGKPELSKPERKKGIVGRLFGK